MESDIERLFHFTKEASALESILIFKEFWVSYCIEDHRFLNEADEFKWLDVGNDEKVIKNVIAYPIVCFCDIPLNERIKAHSSRYGKYGIGMKREWAKKHNISPVQYVSEESLTARIWLNLISKMAQIKRFIHKDYKRFEEQYFNDIIHLATYIKPYRNQENIFYNEREWRYYPPQDPWGENKLRFLVQNDDVDEISDFKKRNGSLKSDFLLPFEYDDIDCLIVPDEKNKERFIRVLEQLDIKRLNIKIIPQL